MIKKRRKALMIGLGALLILVLLAAGYRLITINANAVQFSQSKGLGINVTEANFPEVMSTQVMIKDIPKGAIIMLKTSTKTYTISKGLVKEGPPTKPDITMTLPSSYIPKLSQGLCATLKEASINGDLGYDLHISTLSAAWKFRALMKYRHCI